MSIEFAVPVSVKKWLFPTLKVVDIVRPPTPSCFSLIVVSLPGVTLLRLLMAMLPVITKLITSKEASGTIVPLTLPIFVILTLCELPV